jgi:hypothetical protein
MQVTWYCWDGYEYERGRLDGHVTRMEEKRSTQRILMGKLVKKERLDEREDCTVTSALILEVLIMLNWISCLLAGFSISNVWSWSSATVVLLCMDCKLWRSVYKYRKSDLRCRAKHELGNNITRACRIHGYIFHCCVQVPYCWGYEKHYDGRRFE